MSSITLSTYFDNSDVILYAMRMYSRRNMQVYVEQMFKLLYNRMKNNVLSKEVSFYISELGRIRTINEINEYGFPQYFFIVDEECRPTRIYTKGKACWVKVDKPDRKDNVKVYWNSLCIKTQLKIVNVLYNKFVSTKKWIFKFINTSLNIKDLFDYNEYHSRSEQYISYFSEIAIWKIWKDGIQDNINNMQGNALIRILKTTQSEGYINQRIRTIGKVIAVYDQDGNNNYVVDFITDKSEHITKSIWDFTPEQRRLIVNRMVDAYIRKHKNIFDKFIKNPVVSIAKIIKENY